MARQQSRSGLILVILGVSVLCIYLFYDQNYSNDITSLFMTETRYSPHNSTIYPSVQPIAPPTNQPIASPSNQPITAPTNQPAASPTAPPAAQPIAPPTRQPTALQTAPPAAAPVRDSNETTAYNSSMVDLECDAYFRENFPQRPMRSFFHDLECLIASFAKMNALIVNKSLGECDNIRLIISDREQTLLHSTYTQLFETKVIPHSEWSTNPKIDYACQRAKGWMSNKWGFTTHLQQYIIRKFGITNQLGMSYDDTRFYEEYADILIIDRSHSRHMSNVHQLCQQINVIFNNRCKLMYFDGVPLKTQWEHILNASVIITPHGAAEASLIMARNRPIHHTRVIEICPPYLHCRLKTEPGGKRRRLSGYNYPLCPTFYNKRFFNRKIVAIAREHYLWNCSTYTEERKYSRYDMEREFKRINHFEVDIDLVIKAIAGNTTDHLLISKANMTGHQLMFYNSTKSFDVAPGFQFESLFV